MVKLIVVFLSVLFFSPVFSRPAINESIGSIEAFLPGEGAPICISFEHCKMHDDWTPVVLTIGEFNCRLWMDKNGKVSELREPGAPFIEPVCIIDAADKSLRKEGGALFFDVYEQNNFRTRWRLSSKDAGTVTPKILSREKSGIELCLGTLRLQLKHAALDIKEFSPGLYHVRFHGPMIVLPRPMVYEKAAGKLYSDHEWNNKLTHEQNQNRPQVAGLEASAVSAIPSLERAALIALYNSTNGDSWTMNDGWKSPPLAEDGFALSESWHGIWIVFFLNQMVVMRIDMLANNLVGTLPPELGNLAYLGCLYLHNNQLSGPIPPELGKLIYLDVLLLDNNQLSGPIPPELGNMTHLEYLYLNDNQLSGPIPPELGKLVNLRDIILYENQLSGSIPPELGKLFYLVSLYLNENQLSGPIPPELGKIAFLQKLYLNDNQLSGPIPPELGNLAFLQNLWLSSNQLSGSIPSNLTHLTRLPENNCIDLRWNALYTHDDILRNFLNSKQIGGNWESTQTIAPSDVTATVVSTSSIEIGWTPIVYTSDTGGYRVFYSTTPGGPYTYFGMTADKSASSLTVTGLNPGVTYYFVVQTRTNPHGSNQNIVDSEYSVEVSTATLQNITISGTVTFGGSGLQGVTITLDNGGGTAVTDANGNYSATVPYDWRGTVTPSKTGYDFTPANRSYTNVTVNQTNQDFQGSQVPGLALTSPNGGESWGLNTLRNITWTSAGLAGNIKLELWKASQKLGVIAANISISNGTYAWFVGSYGLGIASTGNDYKVKIMTANGLYNDTGNAPFSILQTSLILTSPRSNESWKLGTLKDITWTSVGLSGNVKLLLFKNGVQIGVIARGIPVTNGTYAWTVGKIYSGLAPTGSNYKVKISSEANPSYSSGSGIFTIL